MNEGAFIDVGRIEALETILPPSLDWLRPDVLIWPRMVETLFNFAVEEAALLTSAAELLS